MADTGNIPTGGAPLFLGNFSSQRGAMAQKLTQQMIANADKENTRQSKERADILKSLSFEAVKGLGRKVQETLLAEITGLQDKYAKAWIAGGRKLTDKQYMEMQRDKTDMDQRIANMKHNVSQYAYYSKDILENPHLYHPETLDNLQSYFQEGDVGQDLSPLIKFMPDTQKYLVDAFKGIGSTASSKSEKFNEERQAFDVTKSNKSEIERKVRAGLTTNPQYKALMADPHTAKQAEASINAFIEQMSTTTTESRTPSEGFFKRRDTEAMPEDTQKIAKKYNWDGLKENEIRELNESHEKVLKILEKDPDMLESLKGNEYITGIGLVDDYDIQKNGDITLYGRVDDSGNKGHVTLHSLIKGNRAQNITAIEQTLKVLPGWTTSKLNKYGGYINPDYEVNVKNPKPPSVVSSAQGYLDVSDADIESGDKGYLNKTERTELADVINSFIPEGDKAEMEGGIFFTGNRWLNWGNDKYNLKNLPDRQKLMDRITKSAGVDKITLQNTKDGGDKGDTEGGEIETELSDISIPKSSRIAFVHNNPGNLMYVGQQGAEKGEKKKGGGYWAKFKTPEEGYEGLKNQIDIDKGKDITISEFIHKYAPSSENNTAAYLDYLIEEIGSIEKDTKLSSIDTNKLAKAVAGKESGATIGEEETAKDEFSVQEFNKENNSSFTKAQIEAQPWAKDFTIID